MNSHSDTETVPYKDRAEAGRLLAETLHNYQGDPDALVAALPLGGVPVGFEIARELRVEFDVFISRKLCTPSRPREALGAIANGCLGFRDPRAISAVAIPTEMVDQIEKREWRELWREDEVYHREHPPARFANRTVILVDDFVATGFTIRAAIRAIRRRFPAEIIVAVPVASVYVLHQLHEEADRVICPESTTEDFRSCQFYQHLAQLDDGHVCDLMRKSCQAGTILHQESPEKSPVQIP